MESNTPIPNNDKMEAYRRQMWEMYRRAAPPPPQEEENWLDRRFPQPDTSDFPVVAPDSPPPEPEAPVPPPIAESPFVGYLRVFAFTANEAEPIFHARVTVSREDTHYANTLTDRDGYTPVIALPSVDPELTLTPGNPTPYVTYTIGVTADGFRSVRHENVPVYGNNYVTQPVVMLPLLPGESAAEQDFVSGGPTNL